MFTKEQFLELEVKRQIDFAMTNSRYFKYLNQNLPECENVLEYYYENSRHEFGNIVEYITKDNLKYLVIRLKGKEFLKYGFKREETYISIPENWFKEDNLLKFYYIDNNLPLRNIISFFTNDNDFNYIWRSFVEGKGLRNSDNLDCFLEAENLPIKTKIDIFKYFEKEIGIVWKQRLGRSSILNISIDRFFEKIKKVSEEELDVYFEYLNKLDDKYDKESFLIKGLFQLQSYKNKKDLNLIQDYFIKFIKKDKNKNDLINEYLYYLENYVEIIHYNLYDNILKQLYLMSNKETKNKICNKFTIDYATLVLGEM